MSEHILPYNFNIWYRIYLKVIEIKTLGMPDAIIMHFKNSLHISARGTAPVHYFTIVSYEKTAVKWVKVQ